MLLSVPAAENDNVEGGDVGNAYLYADIDIHVIMEQPANSTQVETGPGYVCKIPNPIYGAMKAGEIWGSILDKILKE